MEIPHFLSKKLKQFRVVALVSVFKFAGEQMKLTFPFVHFFIINNCEIFNVYGKNTDFHN